MLTRKIAKSQCLRSPLSRFFSDYDLCIIGGGPGGYVAAIKAAQLGLNTVCVEKRGALGGTCLNVGCIPSKALLNISHKYEEMSHASEFGLAADNIRYDWNKILEKKVGIVGGLTKGIEGLFRKNKVTYKVGAGELAGNSQVNVLGNDGKTETLKAKVGITNLEHHHRHRQ
jgi:dihydrolipoamide dehydrogenase